ncbi:hypothetical protein DXB98_09865 [Collinsella sp. OM07-12]|nr:hypothetical protein DXB98_09865 [Collinsella sp. OM07-12]
MYDQSAAHWRQKVGTLGFLFRALREQRLGDNNTYSALSHYVHEKGALAPLKRRCMHGARGETRRAFALRNPGLRAHSALATLRYKQSAGLFA